MLALISISAKETLVRLRSPDGTAQHCSRRCMSQALHIEQKRTTDSRVRARRPNPLPMASVGVTTAQQLPFPFFPVGIDAPKMPSQLHCRALRYEQRSVLKQKTDVTKAILECGASRLKNGGALKITSVCARDQLSPLLAVVPVCGRGDDCLTKSVRNSCSRRGVTVTSGVTQCGC